MNSAPSLTIVHQLHNSVYHHCSSLFDQLQGSIEVEGKWLFICCDHRKEKYIEGVSLILQKEIICSEMS